MRYFRKQIVELLPRYCNLIARNRSVERTFQITRAVATMWHRFYDASLYLLSEIPHDGYIRRCVRVLSGWMKSALLAHGMNLPMQIGRGREQRASDAGRELRRNKQFADNSDDNVTRDGVYHLRVDPGQITRHVTKLAERWTRSERKKNDGRAEPRKIRKMGQSFENALSQNNNLEYYFFYI